MRGVFLNGPELDPVKPPDLPLSGMATYAGGLYTYNYGRNWGELAGSSGYTEFAGTISLTADFAGRHGLYGVYRAYRNHTRPHLFPVVPWQGTDPEALPADYNLRFSASFDVKGAFEDTEITVTHPEREITQTAGTWRGQFSNVPDANGHPHRVVGSNDVHFAEDDGSSGNFRGIFDALMPATLTRDEGGAVKMGLINVPAPGIRPRTRPGGCSLILRLRGDVAWAEAGNALAQGRKNPIACWIVEGYSSLMP